MPRADPDHQVGGRPQPVGRRHRQAEFMGVGDDAAAAAERHHWRVDQFGQFEDFIAGVNGAAADEDHRRLAAGYQRGRGLDAVGIGLRRRQQIERFCRADLGALREHVPRHFQRHRPAPARQHFLERAADHRRRGSGYSMRSAHFTKVRKRRELVRHLMQMAAALAEELGRHLTGQAQHRLVASERGEQRRTGIEHAGPGHHAEHAGPAARPAHSRRPCSRRPAHGGRRSLSTAPDGMRRTGRRSARRAGRTRYRRRARPGR